MAVSTREESIKIFHTKDFTPSTPQSSSTKSVPSFSPDRSSCCFAVSSSFNSLDAGVDKPLRQEMIVLGKVHENMYDFSEDAMIIYERLASKISKEEFIERVQEKVENMSGLCDEKTAALLVAHELGADTVVQIAQIDGHVRAVAFIGKLMRISPVREFTRNGEVGFVANLVVSDETGSIRVVLWNDHAKHAKELQIGQTLRISGTTREGPYGVEVSARDIEIDESVVDTGAELAKDKDHIADLIVGLNGVEISGIILDVGPLRTFSKRDGSIGKVASMTIGDETGKIRVTLWDDRAENAVDFAPGDVLKVINGYTRESYGKLEVHVGNRGAIERCTERIEFTEEISHLKDVQAGVPCTVEVSIENIGSLREFTRDDGSTGRVRNIVVRDDTGEMRAALWGERATAIDEADVDRRITLRDCTPKNGLNDQLELSIDWRSGFCFADQTVREQDQHVLPEKSVEVGITGAVVSSAMLICVDNGADYVAFDKGFGDLTLDVGDEVAVIGARTGDVFRPISVSKPVQDLTSRKLETIKKRLATF